MQKGGERKSGEQKDLPNGTNHDMITTTTKTKNVRQNDSENIKR